MRHLHLQAHFLSLKHVSVHFEQAANSILQYASGNHEGHQVFCLATLILIILAHKVRSFSQSNMAMEEWDNNYNTTFFIYRKDMYIYIYTSTLSTSMFVWKSWCHIFQLEDFLVAGDLQVSTLLPVWVPGFLLLCGMGFPRPLWSVWSLLFFLYGRWPP